MTRKPDNETVKEICKKIHTIKMKVDNWYEYVSAVDDQNPKDSYKKIVLRDPDDEKVKTIKIRDFENFDARSNFPL